MPPAARFPGSVSLGFSGDPFSRPTSHSGARNSVCPSTASSMGGIDEKIFRRGAKLSPSPPPPVLQTCIFGDMPRTASAVVVAIFSNSPLCSASWNLARSGRCSDAARRRDRPSACASKLARIPSDALSCSYNSASAMRRMASARPSASLTALSASAVVLATCKEPGQRLCFQFYSLVEGKQIGKQIRSDKTFNVPFWIKKAVRSLQQVPPKQSTNNVKSVDKECRMRTGTIRLFQAQIWLRLGKGQQKSRFKTLSTVIESTTCKYDHVAPGRLSLKSMLKSFSSLPSQNDHCMSLVGVASIRP
jgi:hypothetical protein